MDDGRFQSWALAEPQVVDPFILPEQGWNFRNDNLSLVNQSSDGKWYISAAMGWPTGTRLTVSDVNDCPQNGLWRQPALSDEGWLWESDIQNKVTLPELNSSNLSWNGSAAGYLLYCDQPVQSWKLVDGPALLLIEEGIPRMDWIGSAWLINSSSAASLSLDFRNLDSAVVFDERIHGNGTGWLAHDVVIDDEKITLNLNWESSDDHLVAWFELSDQSLELHLAAWDIG